MNQFEEVLDDIRVIRLEYKGIELACSVTPAGLEMLDARTFLGALKRIGERSRKVLAFLMNQRNVTVQYIPTTECALNRSVLKHPYTKVGPNVIYIPISFEGQISEFLDFLRDNERDMVNLQKSLEQANTVFSQYIAKPEELGKLDPKLIPKLDRVGNLTREFGEWFGGADGNDRARFEDVYQSYADFASASDSIERLTKTFQEVDIKSIRNSVNDLYDTIDILMKRITEGDVNVSKPVAQSIGGLIYSMADWVAVYSIYISKLVAVGKSHKATAKKLNSL